MALVNLLCDGACDVRRGDVLFSITTEWAANYGLSHTGLALQDAPNHKHADALKVAHATIPCGVVESEWAGLDCAADLCGSRTEHDRQADKPIELEEPIRDRIVQIARIVVNATPSLFWEKRCGFNLEASMDMVQPEQANPNTWTIKEYRFSCSTFANWCYRQASINGEFELVKEAACPEDDSHLGYHFFRKSQCLPAYSIKRLFPGYLMRAFEIDEYPFDAGPNSADWEPWRSFDRFRP